MLIYKFWFNPPIFFSISFFLLIIFFYVIPDDCHYLKYQSNLDMNNYIIIRRLKIPSE